MVDSSIHWWVWPFHGRFTQPIGDSSNPIGFPFLFRFFPRTDFNFHDPTSAPMNRFQRPRTDFSSHEPLSASTNRFQRPNPR